MQTPANENQRQGTSSLAAKVATDPILYVSNGRGARGTQRSRCVSTFFSFLREISACAAVPFTESGGKNKCRNLCAKKKTTTQRSSCACLRVSREIDSHAASVHGKESQGWTAPEMPLPKARINQRTSKLPSTTRPGT